MPQSAALLSLLPYLLGPTLNKSNFKKIVVFPLEFILYKLILII